jgi:phytoene dehydrogenase-like protein
MSRDGVVVGAGHNGLVAANPLADAGRVWGPPTGQGGNR